ncbi:MAG: DsbA family protein [Candidatus Micrarchaeia archaeon]
MKDEKKEEQQEKPTSELTFILSIGLIIILGALIISASIIYTGSMLNKNMQSLASEISKLQILTNMSSMATQENRTTTTTNASHQQSQTTINITGKQILGQQNAPVTIVIFSDFECPYCGALAGGNEDVVSYLKSRDPTWEPAIPNIIRDYVNTGKVKLVFKHFPIHENSLAAAQASECAAKQGKFWEYHDILFANQDNLTIAALKKYASDIGLERSSFDSCLESNETQSIAISDYQEGVKLGVRGTPTLYINNISVVGAQPYSSIKRTIDSELS